MKKNQGILARFIRQFFLKYWLKELVVFGIILVNSLLILLIPYLNKILIDDVLTNRNYHLFYLVLGAMVGAHFIEIIISLVKDYLFYQIGENILRDVRLKLVNHILKLSPAFFTKITVGQLLARVENDVMVLKEVSSSIFIEFVASVMNMIFVIGIMLYLDWKLTVISGVVVMVYMINFKIFGEKTKRKSREQRSSVSNLMSSLSETFTNITTIQLFNKESWVWRGITKKYDDLFRTSFGLKMIQSYNRNFSMGLIVIAVGLVWLKGGWSVMQGTMSIGTIIAYTSYQSRLFSPLRQFAMINNQVQSAMASLERIYEIFEEPIQIIDAEDAIEMSQIQGQIEFKNVDFAYDLNEPILRQANLCVNPGEVVALVGSSGSGKSTVFKLLTRILEPQSGQISIDGIDLHHYKLHSLRDQISIIPQEISIFRTSLLENITFGDEKITSEAVDQLISKVDLASYTANLPQGYQTMLEEGGANLSGGQRKRLGIVRALAKRSKIILIDEAVSSLDTERRQMIRQLIKELRGEHTIILITHYLEEVKDADRIYLLEDGSIRSLEESETIRIMDHPQEMDAS